MRPIRALPPARLAHASECARSLLHGALPSATDRRDASPQRSITGRHATNSWSESRDRCGLPSIRHGTVTVELSRPSPHRPGVVRRDRPPAAPDPSRPSNPFSASLLIDRDAVIEVAEFLRPEDFYRQATRRRSTAPILELYERREPVDLVTVSEALERGRPRGDRRPAYLTQPHQPDPDRRQRRRTTPGSSSARRSCGTSSAAAGRSPASATRIRPMSRRRSTGQSRSCSRSARSGSSAASRRSSRLLHAAYDRLDYLHQHRGEISGIRTGFKDLDTLTTGLPAERPRSSSPPAHRSARRASRSTSRSTRPSATARASASSASR